MESIEQYRGIVRKFSVLIILISVLISTACKEGSWQDLFTFKSIRSAKGDDIEELEDRVKKYEKVLDKRIESSHELGMIYQKLGVKYLDRKAWSSAIDSFEKAIGYGRDNPIVHNSLAVAYANRGKEIVNNEDIKKAEYHYKRTLEIRPDYHDARYGLGILLFYIKGDRGEGLKVMEGLVSRDKKYYLARFALGRFYYELEKLERSLSVYEALYSDLQGLKGSSQIEEYKKGCKINIERLMRELARKR